MPARKSEQPPSRVKINSKWKYNPAYEKWLCLKNPSRREYQKMRSEVWQKTHQKESSWKTLRYYYRIRREIFDLLGNKCSNPECPVPPEKMDLRCLQIDHVYGGGCSAKNNKTNPSRYSFYKNILEEIKNGSQEYALLCVYCNWKKRYLNKELYRKYQREDSQ